MCVCLLAMLFFVFCPSNFLVKNLPQKHFYNIRQRSWSNVMYSSLFVTLRNSKLLTQRVFAKYIGQWRLLLCEIFDFRKVYWSPRSVCLFVCAFVCLSVFLLCTDHTAGPIVLIFGQLMYSGPRTILTFILENRMKGKVKVTTFVKNR